MDFSWGPELTRFRDEVRAFADQHSSPALLHDVEVAGEEGAGPHLRSLQQEMDRRGWRKISLPEEYGGEGKSPWYQYILTEEMGRRGILAPDLNTQSIAPAIARFGTEAQKQKYLPAIWSGEITFAIGYSEPNAGTDLASLQTRARRDGDEWVINGQKIWTTAAHVATHVWLAARTDPDAPKHRGISVLIVPLNSPGITVRPLPTMGGMRTNEVFFEDVRVPADALIGEENQGWYIVMDALNHERVTIAPLGGLVRPYELLIEYLKTRRPELLQDPQVRLRLAEIKVDLHVQRALKTINASIIANGDTPVKEASMTKVWSTELRHRMSSLVMDILGRYGGLSAESGDLAPLAGVFDRSYRNNPPSRFGGGTNEIQRDIIAQRGLRLPR